MSTSPTTDRPGVTLFVRSSTTGAETQKRRILDRLRTLADEGQVADVEVRSWPAEIDTDDVWTEHEARLHDTVGQFKRWAEDAGAELEPFFRTRTDTHLATDRERTVQVLPVMAVAVYDATATLKTVAPHARPGGSYTVRDCVADLEAETDDTDERVKLAHNDRPITT